MNNQIEESNSNITESIARSYNSLVFSYKNLQNILSPNLTEKKQEVLSLLMSLITNQITIYQEMINQEIKSEIIPSNLENLAKDIASILKYINEKETKQILSYSFQNSFSIIPIKRNIRDQFFTCFNNSNQCERESLRSSTETFKKSSNNKITRIYNNKYQKKDDKAEQKDIKAKKISQPNKKEEDKKEGRYIKNRMNQNSLKSLKGNATKRPISPLISLKDESNLKNLQMTTIQDNTLNDSIKKDLNQRCHSDLKNKIPRNFSIHNTIKGLLNSENKPPIKYETFVEKTFKDFEKIGAKPTKFAKYLVKKYKDVVDRYEKLDSEEEKRENCIFTPHEQFKQKKNNSNKPAIKTKRRLESFPSISWINMNDLDEELVKKEGINNRERILVKKQK